MSRGLGLRAAYVYTVLIITFNLAYVAMAVSESAILGFVPQIIGLVMLPASLVLFSLLACALEGDKKTWGIIGLGFHLLYVGIVSAVYFVQVSIVIPLVLCGAEVSKHLLMSNPQSVVWAVNYLGWGFLGVSLLFYAAPLGRTGTEGIIKWLFVFVGVTSLLAVLGYLMDSMTLQVGVLFAWVFALPASAVFLIKWFREIGTRTVSMNRIL